MSQKFIKYPSSSRFQTYSAIKIYIQPIVLIHLKYVKPRLHKDDDVIKIKECVDIFQMMI
ncbi:unnamed protein product [Paramecium octaurelia]|uniref:Uncharacterized protein n=1 Tax=Paramecium octaurelia TaxID=43137 RepID=A0A8S1U5P8_PAROT|nr:unnamed protein product [Paramecium octaurelia]